MGRIGEAWTRVCVNPDILHQWLCTSDSSFQLSLCSSASRLLRFSPSPLLSISPSPLLRITASALLRITASALLRISPPRVSPSLLWCKLAQRNVLCYVLPCRGQRCKASGGEGLDQHVANDSRFYRPSQHRPAGRIRRCLVQILILAASADDLHAGNCLFCQLLDCAQDRGITQSKRV